MMHNKLLKWLLPTIAVGLITACSSGSSSSSNSGGGGNGDASTLQILTPKIIYSKTASVGNGYVTVINPTTTTIKNLSYSLNNPVGSGSSASIDEASAANCAVIAANSQCNIKLNVAAGAVAGSLGFCVSNNGSLLSKIIKSTQGAKTAQLPIGIEQAYYNNVSGADGITLSYYHTVIAGVPYILVSGIVASDKAGSFNKIVLVDGNGNPLPNQQLISGNVSSAQGSTFTVLLPVSASSGISQTIKVQTQQVATDGSVTVVSTGAASTLVTTTGVGIADSLPGAVYLTGSHPEQTITFVNSGDIQAQLQSFAANNPNIEVTFNPTSLASGATTTATLKLKNPVLPATSGAITLTYNNGKETKTSTAVVEQNVSPQPNPNPSPTPSPTPPVPPAPTASLTTAFSPDNDFFTTTAIGTASRQLTLTNRGSTVENNIVLTLPANFTISSGNSNSCTVTQGTTVSDNLAANNGSCNLTVSYSNSTVTAQSAATISIAYDYNNGTAAPTPATAAVNYQVTQSSANLSVETNPITFANVLNNNVDYNQQTVTIKNSGDIPATNLAFSITGTDSALFSTQSGGTCVSGGSLSNAIGSNTCTINTQFGPAASEVTGTSKTASLDVSYTPYSGGATASTSATLNGQLEIINTPAITSSVSVSNCQIGSGINNDICLINTGNPAPVVTITFTNTGGTANNFTLNTTTLATALGSSAYNTTFGGNCGNSISLNSGDSCTLTINPISPTTTASDALYNINSTVPYSYQYGSSGQIAGSGNATVIVDSLVATPTLIISDTIAAIDATGNAIADVTLGNWYNSVNEPTKPTFGGSIVTAAGVTISGCDSWTSGAWYSMSCQATITTSATPAGTYDITAEVNAGVSGTITSVPATVIVKPATPRLHIFVTSTTYNGDLQTAGGGATGFDGANNICNTLAAAGSTTSSLPGQWKALLYNNNATVTGTTYYDTSANQNEIAIATGSDLVGKNAISSAIKYDENGAAIATSTSVWTNGNANTNDCGGWTVSTAGIYGGYGNLNSATATWFYSQRQYCSVPARLYCVQQPADG